MPGGHRTISHLVSDDPGETRFQAVTLEDLTSAVGAAGADTIAAVVTERYLDFEPVHRDPAQTFQPPSAAVLTPPPTPQHPPRM